MLARGPWFCKLPPEAWPEGEEAAAFSSVHILTYAYLTLYDSIL
jgi:hypothetical protein